MMTRLSSKLQQKRMDMFKKDRDILPFKHYAMMTFLHRKRVTDVCLNTGK